MKDFEKECMWEMGSNGIKSTFEPHPVKSGDKSEAPYLFSRIPFGNK
jgi:hypothetical protein